MTGAVRVEAGTGTPVRVEDVTVTPEFQALTVRLPIARFVWSRPTAVVVERAGETHRVPVLDLTRVVQLGLLGGAVLVTIVSLVVRARHRA